MWVAIVISAISLYVAYTQTPRAPEAQPPILDISNTPTAEEGIPIPVVFGTRVLKNSNVVWYGDLKYEKVESEGGK